MTQNKVGTWGEPVIWPNVDIEGRSYTRPCTTIGIDDENLHFVVVPPAFDRHDLIEELKASIDGQYRPDLAARDVQDPARIDTGGKKNRSAANPD